MRTAAICPTCATYTNAVCVIYDGPYLSNLAISPMSSLDDALQQINFVAGTFEKTANKSTSIIADQSSNIKYPSVKAVYEWANSTFGPALGFTPENVANKSTNIVTDQSSNTKYPSVKAVYDWVTLTYQPLLAFTPENVANKSTNTSLGTSNTLYPTQNAVKVYVDTAVAAVPIPTLNQVTGAGNVSTANILVSSNGGGIIGTEKLSNPNKYAVLRTDLSGDSGLLQLGNINGKGARIEAENITDDRTYQLPDSSGTLALKSYKVYIAKITQFGTNAPIEEAVIENDFVNPVTFSYNGVGQYSLDCLDIGNNADKIALYFQQGSGSFGITYQLTAITNSISISSYSNVSNALTNNAFTKACIEVRIYP